MGGELEDQYGTAVQWRGARETDGQAARDVGIGLQERTVLTVSRNSRTAIATILSMGDLRHGGTGRVRGRMIVGGSGVGVALDELDEDLLQVRPLNLEAR